MRRPLSRGERLLRVLAVPVVAVWTLIAAIALVPGPVGYTGLNAVTGWQADEGGADAKNHTDRSGESGNPATEGTVRRLSAERCEELAAPDRVPVRGHDEPDGAMRVFAIQYHLDLRHAASYDTYRDTMRCLVETLVLPHVVPDRPTLVVFPEDVGLPTIATGQRGLSARAQARSPLRALSETVPLGMGSALLQLQTAYGPQIAAYQAKFGPVDPRKQVFLAATDTFVRAFSQTFSAIALDYGIYVVAGNNQARYRATRNPAEIAMFADPATLPTDEAYVAVSPHVTNSTFLWGPQVVDPAAPRGERNLLFRNEKVPLTALEADLLGLDEGPAAGDAALENARGVEVEGFRLGFATSLPAFKYGYPFGDRPAGFQPCRDLRESYAACMDELGVDVMIQADANPGRWTATLANGSWQPLEWMSSVWRAVADPTVGFRYNVTPMMNGNLFDLIFDGQSSITARGVSGPKTSFAGTATSAPGDPPEYAVYAGPKSEFLALAPWSGNGDSRSELVVAAAELAPRGSRENRYVETAIYADLVAR